MTHKAQKILDAMRKLDRKASKWWKPDSLTDPKTRESFLDRFNQSTLDQVGAIGGDKGEKFLKELNEMADLERDAGQKESPDT